VVYLLQNKKYPVYINYMRIRKTYWGGMSYHAVNALANKIPTSAENYIQNKIGNNLRAYIYTIFSC
jgi:hypothetical protein